MWKSNPWFATDSQVRKQVRVHPSSSVATVVLTSPVTLQGSAGRVSSKGSLGSFISPGESSRGLVHHVANGWRPGQSRSGGRNLTALHPREKWGRVLISDPTSFREPLKHEVHHGGKGRGLLCTVFLLRGGTTSPHALIVLINTKRGRCVGWRCLGTSHLTLRSR